VSILARPMGIPTAAVPDTSSITSIRSNAGEPMAPFNMQWQTIADGKAKDKTERNCRL
jgi:hypothetical protein